MVRPSFWDAVQDKAQFFFALQLLHNKRVFCECWLLGRGRKGKGGEGRQGKGEKG